MGHRVRRTAAAALMSGLAVLIGRRPGLRRAGARASTSTGTPTPTARGSPDPATGYTRLLASERHEVLHSFGRNGSQALPGGRTPLRDRPGLVAHGSAWRRAHPGQPQHGPRLRDQRPRARHLAQLAARHAGHRRRLPAHRGLEPHAHATVAPGTAGRCPGPLAGRCTSPPGTSPSSSSGRSVASTSPLRGASGRGIDIRVSDRTAGRTVAHLNTGDRVHPAYDHAGIPLLYRIPVSMAHHVIRLTKQSGRGSFTFDARLPAAASIRARSSWSRSPTSPTTACRQPTRTARTGPWTPSTASWTSWPGSSRTRSPSTSTLPAGTRAPTCRRTACTRTWQATGSSPTRWRPRWTSTRR